MTLNDILVHIGEPLCQPYLQIQNINKVLCGYVLKTHFSQKQLNKSLTDTILTVLTWPMDSIVFVIKTKFGGQCPDIKFKLN